MDPLLREHIYLPGVEMIPVRAFRITPLEDRGLMTVDGELVPRGVMQVNLNSSLFFISILKLNSDL